MDGQLPPSTTLRWSVGSGSPVARPDARTERRHVTTYLRPWASSAASTRRLDVRPAAGTRRAIPRRAFREVAAFRERSQPFQVLGQSRGHPCPPKEKPATNKEANSEWIKTQPWHNYKLVTTVCVCEHTVCVFVCVHMYRPLCGSQRHLFDVS